VIIERIFGVAILALMLLWLVANLFKAPSQFAEVTLIGLSNGVLYALIALGYTLVYGIIELINFAHGDSSCWEGFSPPTSSLCGFIRRNQALWVG
jgi:branched-chain amino acid transport system permease protein